MGCVAVPLLCLRDLGSTCAAVPHGMVCSMFLIHLWLLACMHGPIDAGMGMVHVWYCNTSPDAVTGYCERSGGNRPALNVACLAAELICMRHLSLPLAVEVDQ
jgi:hypothetical protein